MIDVAVLILFFNRPESFERLWAELRKAQPAQLLLYQDGPRGERDMPGIEACRKIAENIDWPCKVYRNYQTENRGCDPSNFLAQKWAFSIVDKCIVMEDDDVPTISFFKFCKEMLDRYENDPKVCMITGFNTEEFTHAGGASYVFTRNFSIWGWASWRRVIDQWDENYRWLDDETEVKRLENYIRKYRLRDDFIQMARAHRASGKAYYETIFCSLMWRNDWFAIVPTSNQISNLGVSDNSVHFSGSIRQLPRGYRRIFTMGRHEMDFPLQHPPTGEPGMEHKEFEEYRKNVYRIMAWGHPWVKVFRSFEELFINICHGQWGYITKAMRKRWKKWTKGQEYY